VAAGDVYRPYSNVYAQLKRFGEICRERSEPLPAFVDLHCGRSDRRRRHWSVELAHLIRVDHKRLTRA